MPGLLLLLGVGAFVLMAIANNQSTTPPITPPFPTAPPRPKPPDNSDIIIPAGWKELPSRSTSADLQKFATSLFKPGDSLAKVIEFDFQGSHYAAFSKRGYIAVLQRMAPVEPPPPPITLTPGGRYMTPFERYALRSYFDPKVFDYAKLWFGRPASSFTQEGDAEKGLITEALTTNNGIYFRAPNHEMNSAEDFALLAHELVHAGQHLDGTAATKTSAEKEFPAYQTQTWVLRELPPIAQLRSEFASQPRV